MRNRKKKIFGIILLILIISSNTLFGKTNNEYGGQQASIDITDSTIQNNLVIDYIGHFIFALGNIFQSVTSGIMGVFTGNNVFPWADMIVFNTIPILDVNFINPEPSSLFSEATETLSDGTTSSIGIGEVIRNIYFTGLSISLSFMGILVAIMAIRLAVSSIGSEKAKYKEAITKWATSLVLLFSMHYFIAFMFYMNEELVIVASHILSDTIKDSGQKIAEIINEKLNENKDVIVQNFINKAGNKLSSSDKQVLNDNIDITYMLLSNPEFREALDYVSGSDTTGMVDHLGRFGSKIIEGVTVGNYNSPEEQQIGFLIDCVSIIESATDSYANKANVVQQKYDQIDEYTDVGTLQRVAVAYWALAEKNEDALTAINEKRSNAGENPDEWTSIYLQVLTDYGGPDISGYSIDQLKTFAKESIDKQFGAISNVKDTIEQEIKDLESSMGSLSGREKESANALLIALNYGLKATKGELNLNQNNENIIANLGEYFKQAAWTIDVNNNGWAPSEVSIISAILYTIFVCQSISFFISYIKRILMVAILAILAPFVVIYDFFKKTTFNNNNGGIISVWLKELSSLIFVQTFQAFLLAIIMSIIVRAIAGTYASTMNGGIEAAGLLAIFALLSLPKLELLVKQIFGLTSGVADTSLAGGQRSLSAGGVLAMRAGKRLLDNPKKVVHGARMALKGVGNKGKSNNKLPNGRSGELNSDSSEENAENNTSNSSTGRINPTRLGSSGSNNELSSAIRSLTDAVNTQNNIMNAQEFEEKGNKNSAGKEIASGLAETVGALHGAVAGAVIGAGFDKGILNSSTIGAGVGDKVGETAVNIAYEAPDVASEIGKAASSTFSNLFGKNGKGGSKKSSVVNNNTTNNTNNIKNSIKNTTKIESNSSGNSKNYVDELSKKITNNIQNELNELKKDVEEYKKVKDASSPSDYAKEIEKKVSETMKKNSNSNRLNNTKKNINVDDL